MDTKSPSQDAIDSITQHYNSIKAVFPEAVADFDSRWEAAQPGCYMEPSTIPTIDNLPCVETAEFKSIQKLGPKIVPFILNKLAKDDSGENTWGVLLYTALESDPTYSPSLKDQTLRASSASIVELNYERNKIVDRRIEIWNQVHQENEMAASSSACTWTDEYDDLCMMGTSLIAPLMLAFHRDQDGYWWDLLHEIIHGHKMGAMQYVKPDLYAWWDRFFRYGEHEQAPDYILTPFDRYVKFGEEVGPDAPPRRMSPGPKRW